MNGQKKDAEMTEREKGGREGGEGGKGFQGAAGSRSTQTDAVERCWLEEKEQGKCVCVYVSVCVSVCWGRGREGVGVKL